VTIRKSLVVGCPPEQAFTVFTREIGRWWPLRRGFSFDRDRAHEIVLDDHVGGRFFERFTDGWDVVLAFYLDEANRQQRRQQMKLYHFPSPNPQKVTFALLELGLDCETIPVDLAKGEQRQPAFLAVNPFGRVPVLVDGELTLTESHAILAYLGEKTGRLWPAVAGARAQALQWLFFLSQHMMPAAGEVALRIRSKVTGIAVDEAVVARGEQALQAVLPMVEAHLAQNRWMLGGEFSLVDCAYCPIFNVIDKAGFSLAGFPQTSGCLDRLRARPAWRETPKLPLLA
jgi:glutathione S-transferase